MSPRINPVEDSSVEKSTPAAGSWVQRKAVRPVLILAGCSSVILGAIGILLPGLPTTPFLLLAAALFAKSSPALYDILIRSRVFGPYIEEWRRYRSIRPHVRYAAAIVVVLGLCLSLSVTSISTPWKIANVILGIVGLCVVFRIPVRRSP
ncbi:MAG: YbaN family protein [Planctomyces sp.]|nr:YbaN family protein [Planctomyces sp.]